MVNKDIRGEGLSHASNPVAMSGPVPRLSSVMIGAALLGAGCALLLDEQTLYLRSAQDRATQQEVRGRLGRPFWAGTPRAGETVWVYQIREPEQGGNNSWTITGFWCDEYVLTFDGDGVLRRWTHRSQKHRDERSQADCVSDGFRPPS